LKITAPYEFSQASPFGDEIFMYLTYVRGEAYLAAGDGISAAAEFRKLLDHPGVAVNCIFSPLSRLQLARATVMIGDRVEARKEYEKFLTDWKEADPEVPVLKQAKSEYESLR
jgi:eukaryotic-like serine/threonine-protein kinase